MPHKQKLSLGSAVLICMNIVIGAGVFINSIVLPQKAGFLSSFSYLAIGILLLPLIAAVMELIRLHPSGGFYVFGAKELHPLAGFLASWSYAIAKVCSVSVIIHSATLFSQRLIPVLLTIPALWIDYIVLLWFAWLNTLGTKTGTTIQRGFLVTKLLALIMTILAGFSHIGKTTITIVKTDFSGFASTLPLVLFAMVGFEAVCIISTHIKHSRKNAPRAIAISYGLVLILYTIYQLGVYIGAGPIVLFLQSFQDLFPVLLDRTLPNSPLWAFRITNAIYFCIVAAGLGGSYGLLFTNTWNFYHLTKAVNNKLSQKLCQLNRHGVPVWSVATQVILTFFMLLLVAKNHLPIQQLSAFGCSVTYLVITIALLRAKSKPSRKRKILTSWPTTVLAVLNSIGLVITCLVQFFTHSTIPLYLFMLWMACGIVYFFCSSLKNKRTVH